MKPFMLAISAFVVIPTIASCGGPSPSDKVRKDHEQLESWEATRALLERESREHVVTTRYAEQMRRIAQERLERARAKLSADNATARGP